MFTKNFKLKVTEIVTEDNKIKGLDKKGRVLKELDLDARIVKAYVSVFDFKDMDGDIIRKGAFKKTIQENLPRIQHLYQHDPYKPIGKILSLEEDDYGLLMTSKLSTSTLGEDVWKLYTEGILREHSIGFNVMKRDPEDPNIFTEVRLWEASTVTWGANELATVAKDNSVTAKIKSMLEQDEDPIQHYPELREVYDLLKGHFNTSKKDSEVIEEEQDVDILSIFNSIKQF